MQIIPRGIARLLIVKVLFSVLAQGVPVLFVRTKLRVHYLVALVFVIFSLIARVVPFDCLGTKCA